MSDRAPVTQQELLLRQLAPPAPSRSVALLRRRFNGRNAASQRRFEAPSPVGGRVAPALSEQRIEGIKGLVVVVGPPV